MNRKRHREEKSSDYVFKNVDWFTTFNFEILLTFVKLNFLNKILHFMIKPFRLLKDIGI